MKNLSRIMLAVGVAATAACASSTTIRSNPPGAKVYLNGEYKGTTPYMHQDKSISGTKTPVILKKEGYQPTEGAISRNSGINGGAVVGGLFVGLPFLWVMDYPDSYTFEMERTAK